MKLRTQLLTHNLCYRAGKTIMPQGIMVHSTGANNPRVSRYVPGDDVLGYNRGGNHWDQPELGVCVHAFIGRFADGTVGTVQTLPWNRRGWHCGQGKGGSGNDTHISFEICEDDLKSPTYFRAVYQEAVELTAYLCRKYSLDPLDDGVVICHSEGHTRGIASNHADVMHWFPRYGKNMDTFRADVARQLEGVMDLTQEQIRKIVREEIAKAERERESKPAAPWAKPYIQRAIDSGLMAENGSGSIDRPMAAMSRQEAAAFGVAVLEASARKG